MVQKDELMILQQSTCYCWKSKIVLLNRLLIGKWSVQQLMLELQQGQTSRLHSDLFLWNMSYYLFPSYGWFNLSFWFKKRQFPVTLSTDNSFVKTQFRIQESRKTGSWQKETRAFLNTTVCNHMSKVISVSLWLAGFTAHSLSWQASMTYWLNPGLHNQISHVLQLWT